MAIMLPVAAGRALGELLAVPAAPPGHRPRDAGADRRGAGARRGTIVWRDPATGERFETPVTGGHAKLQWKPDWAMRWVALGVDYEMAGKDLIDSVKLSARIARALGGEPPEGFNYELFLDEKGQKISKSKGNGLTIDEWLDLRHAESPRPVHVQQAARGQAPVLRRDPAARRRVYRLPRPLCRPGREAAARQPGLAHPCRQPAGAGAGRGREPDLRDAAQPRRGGQHRGSGGAVGLHPPLRAADRAGDPSGPRPAGGPRADVLLGLRAARQDLPGADARGAGGPGGPVGDPRAAHAGSTDPEALQAAVYEVGRRHFPDTSGKAKSPDGRPGRVPGVVHEPLQRAVRRGARAPLRLLRGPLRGRRDPGADRRRPCRGRWSPSTRPSRPARPRSRPRSRERRDRRQPRRPGGDLHARPWPPPPP